MDNSLAVVIVRVISLGLGVVSIILSGLTCYYFIQRNPPRALIEHVRKVSFAYVAFVVVGLSDTVTRFDEPFRWQTFGYLIVFALSANSQTPLLWYEKKALLKEQLANRRTGEVHGRRMSDSSGVWIADTPALKDLPTFDETPTKNDSQETP